MKLYVALIPGFLNQKQLEYYYERKMNSPIVKIAVVEEKETSYYLREPYGVEDKDDNLTEHIDVKVFTLIMLGSYSSNESSFYKEKLLSRSLKNILKSNFLDGEIENLVRYLHSDFLTTTQKKHFADIDLLNSLWDMRSQKRPIINYENTAFIHPIIEPGTYLEVITTTLGGLPFITKIIN
jgi:hypothetical protein